MILEMNPWDGRMMLAQHPQARGSRGGLHVMQREEVLQACAPQSISQEPWLTLDTQVAPVATPLLASNCLE